MPARMPPSRPSPRIWPASMPLWRNPKRSKSQTPIGRSGNGRRKTYAKLSSWQRLRRRPAPARWGGWVTRAYLGVTATPLGSNATGSLFGPRKASIGPCSRRCQPPRSRTRRIESRDSIAIACTAACGSLCDSRGATIVIPSACATIRAAATTGSSPGSVEIRLRSKRCVASSRPLRSARSSKAKVERRIVWRR